MLENKTYIPEQAIAAIATPLHQAPWLSFVVREKKLYPCRSNFSRPEALQKAAGNTTLYGWIVDGEKS